MLIAVVLCRYIALDVFKREGTQPKLKLPKSHGIVQCTWRAKNRFPGRVPDATYGRYHIGPTLNKMHCIAVAVSRRFL